MRFPTRRGAAGSQQPKTGHQACSCAVDRRGIPRKRGTCTASRSSSTFCTGSEMNSAGGRRFTQIGALEPLRVRARARWRRETLGPATDGPEIGDQGEHAQAPGLCRRACLAPTTAHRGGRLAADRLGSCQRWLREAGPPPRDRRPRMLWGRRRLGGGPLPSHVGDTPSRHGVVDVDRQERGSSAAKAASWGGGGDPVNASRGMARQPRYWIALLGSCAGSLLPTTTAASN